MDRGDRVFPTLVYAKRYVRNHILEDKRKKDDSKVKYVWTIVEDIMEDVVKEITDEEKNN